MDVRFRGHVLRVAEGERRQGRGGTSSVTITVGNGPQVTISTPGAGLTWAVGDHISFQVPRWIAPDNPFPLHVLCGTSSSIMAPARIATTTFYKPTVACLRLVHRTRSRVSVRVGIEPYGDRRAGCERNEERPPASRRRSPSRWPPVLRASTRLQQWRRECPIHA